VRCRRFDKRESLCGIRVSLAQRTQLTPDVAWDRDFGSACSSRVAMMQPADHREGDNLSPIGGLALAEFGGVLIEREVGPGAVIVNDCALDGVLRRDTVGLHVFPAFLAVRHDHGHASRVLCVAGTEPANCARQSCAWWAVRAFDSPPSVWAALERAGVFDWHTVCIAQTSKRG
jgi:hypothetical protein